MPLFGKSSLPPSSAVPSAWLELPDGKLHWLQARCVVGRQPGCDLILAGHTISRQHAMLAADAAGYSLTDLHSSNGTSVNNAHIARPTLLRDGDEIRFGEVIVRFRCTRQQTLSEPTASPATTQHIEQLQTRACWLLLADVEAYAALNEKLGSETALRRLQAWIGDVRPLIEQNAGRINGYLGDAVFAYWPSDTAKPADVHATLRALESYRHRSALPFRLVAHHGTVLFTRSARGEELSGQEVNFVFRIEKIAKSFGSRAMLSSAAVSTLKLDGRCDSYGRSAIDGMSDFFTFYALPRDFIVQPPARS